VQVELMEEKVNEVAENDKDNIVVQHSLATCSETNK
jgi:hypothetical protein